MSSKTSPSDTSRKPQELSFETALAELEKLVAAMEGSAITLEQSVQAYQRGAELIRLCQGHLEEARVKLQVVEGGELRPLDLQP
jgi:exodeoxyribonuclease VII small subunit